MNIPQHSNQHKPPDKERSLSLLGIAAKGSIVTLLGTLAGKGLLFFFRVMVTRIFGAKYFGLLVLGMMVSEFARIFASIGLPRGGMRFVSMTLGSQKPEKLPAIFATAFLIPFLISIVMSGFLFGFAKTIALSWFKNAALVPILRIFVFSIPFAALVRVGVDVSKGFNTTKYSVFTENLFTPFMIVMLFGLFYGLGAGFNAVIYGIIVTNMLSAVLIFFFLKTQLKAALGSARNKLDFLHNCVNIQESREVILYSFPLFLTGFSVIIINSTDIIMLGRFLDAASVGVYGAASIFATFASSLLIMSLNSIFAPLVATQYGKNATDNIGYLYIATTRWMAYLALPLIVSLIIAREQFMRIFGEEFIVGGPTVLFILLIGHGVNCITGGVGQILSMTGHQKKELSINVAAIVLNIGLNLLLIPVLGIIGAAIATSTSQILVNLLRVIIVHKMLRVQPFTVKLFNFFLIGTGLVVLSFVIKIYLFSGIYDLAVAVFSLVLMLAAIFVLKIEHDDKKLLKMFTHRVKVMLRIA